MNNIEITKKESLLISKMLTGYIQKHRQTMTVTRWEQVYSLQDKLKSLRSNNE